MAQNKKSFLLYIDIISTIEKLTDEQAGKLFKIILEYVNDKNPEPDDILLQIAFEPIKQNLKRDLKKWENFIEKQRLNGEKGGRPSLKNETQKTQAFLQKPKKAVNVNVNVNVNVSDNENENNKWKELIFNWLEYKKEKKQSYKNEKSIQAFINKLIRLSNNDIKIATIIIENSMAANYDGIFPCKDEDKQLLIEKPVKQMIVR